MEHILTQAARELSEGGNLCLASIIRQVGSAPRSLGTSFYVRPDGSIAGTIGGGRLEAEVMQRAAKALAEQSAQLLFFRLKGDEVEESDMLCGGDVDIYLEPIYGSDPAAGELFQGAARNLAQGRRALLATAMLPGPCRGISGRKLLLSEGDQPPLGGIEDLPELPGELSPQVGTLCHGPSVSLSTFNLAQGGELPVILEPLCGKPMVYLFGAGHVSLALGRALNLLDFGLVVIDDRREFANRERFPFAQDIWVRPFPGVLDEVDLGPDDYVVIMTRGHKFDLEVLSQALAKETAYVGMIGSRRKRGLIYQALEKQGYSKERIGEVHSPIGLDIGAETPEEIAISVCAELIQVRAGRKPHNRKNWEV